MRVTSDTTSTQRAELKELLVSAAAALETLGPPSLSPAPIGLPVREGRVSLGKQRMALGPGACDELAVVAGFGTAVWLGRPGTAAPPLGRLVWHGVTSIDPR